MSETKLEGLPIDPENITPPIIKVIGVGGGGGNAVNHMYRQGITDVTFVVCNTDNQDLRKSPVPYKIQLGPKTTSGLGAGANPEIGRLAAEESFEDIKEMLSDDTKMVFITAGMGGGTGTGASPVIARAAKQMGILTIGIVTIPFLFEGTPKIRSALEGVQALNEHVDAILVINNEKLRILYPDMKLSEAFSYADDVLANAAKSIAQIVTIPGHINLDFADVKRILENGQVAVMNTGIAEGESRIEKAIFNALHSPLLDNEINTSKKILLNFYCSQSEDQISMEEISQINKFMKQMSENIDVIWGVTYDDSLGKAVKVTLIATGFDIEAIPGMKELPKIPKPQIVEPTPTQPEPQTISPNIAAAAEKSHDQIDNAIEGFYKNFGIEKKSTEQIHEVPMPSVSIEDLEDDLKLKNTENVPAYLRGW